VTAGVHKMAPGLIVAMPDQAAPAPAHAEVGAP